MFVRKAGMPVPAVFDNGIVDHYDHEKVDHQR